VDDEEITRELHRVSSKLDELMELVRTVLQRLPVRGELKPLDAQELLALPDHLRMTAMAIRKLGEATAGEVSRETGRARAVESGYLNRLVGMGYLKKERRGRWAYFYAQPKAGNP